MKKTPVHKKPSLPLRVRKVILRDVAKIISENKKIDKAYTYSESFLEKRFNKIVR